MGGLVHEANPNHQTDEDGGVDHEPDDRGSHQLVVALFPVGMPRGTSYVFCTNDEIVNAVRPRQAHSLVKVVVVEEEHEEGVCNSFRNSKADDRIILEEGANNRYGSSLED